MKFLAVCAIIKNEEAYIYEWLSYHHHVGVEGFILFDNMSTDRTRKIIESWSAKFGEVIVIEWPYRASQNLAYLHAINRFKDFAKWCAFIDCDEFLVPQERMSVTSVLRYFETLCTGLYVHWLMFGSSGLVQPWPGFVTEVFRRRALNSFPPNKVGKSIVKLAYAQAVEGSHWITSAGKTINDSEVEVRPGLSHSPSPSHRFLALNHYYTRSISEWTSRRSLGRVSLQPSNPNFRRNFEDFKKHDVNSVCDNRAADIISLVRESSYYEGVPYKLTIENQILG